MNKICFVSIDVEADNLIKGKFSGVENLSRILDIFKKYSVSATLFVTGAVLAKYPQIIQEWADTYEIACHGFSHRFWNELTADERKSELEEFIKLCQTTLGAVPSGFRAPSHIIDSAGIKLLDSAGFVYDSSVVPHYPPFKKYRGFKGKAPVLPYHPHQLGILEIPVTGLLLGIPLAGTWLRKLPLMVYKALLGISAPEFLTLNLHSWDALNPRLLTKLDQILAVLNGKEYDFLSGKEVYASIH